MLKYTFTRREKALLLALALIVVALAWFVLVYQRTTNQITRLESEIVETQSQIELDQARVGQLNTMREVVAQRKAEGVAPTVMPEYDNVKLLMAELNAIMAASDDYALTFDELNRDDPEFVSRGVRINYSCGSYKKAEALVDALANGTYPCRIDAVSIADASASEPSAAKESPAVAAVHVTFFERYSDDTASAAVPRADEEAEATS